MVVREREKGEQWGEEGRDGGGVGGSPSGIHSKPICCLVNRLILREGPGLASSPQSAIRPAIQGTSRGYAERGPRLGPLNGRIKAGIEGYRGVHAPPLPPPPLFVLWCLPKQTHPPVPWKLLGGGQLGGNRWRRGLKLGN